MAVTVRPPAPEALRSVAHPAAPPVPMFTMTIDVALPLANSQLTECGVVASDLVVATAPMYVPMSDVIALHELGTCAAEVEAAVVVEPPPLVVLFDPEPVVVVAAVVVVVDFVVVWAVELQATAPSTMVDDERDDRDAAGQLRDERHEVS